MQITLKEPTPCAACGGDPVRHRAIYITLAIEEISGPLFFVPAQIGQIFSRLFRTTESAIGPYFHALMHRLDLAEYKNEWDDKTMLLAQMLWREANDRGIIMREFRLFGLPRNLFLAQFPSGRRMTFEGIPLPPSASRTVSWLDNKAIMQRKFQKLGIPVARGDVAFTKKGAIRIFEGLEAPVIVKPHIGSASRHTTLHIRDTETLLRAFLLAKEVSPYAVVQEELVGPVYRATVVDGALAAVLRRDPPRVVGDGVHTIEELVAEANKHPGRQGPYFSHIKLIQEAHDELAWQGYTQESIPPSGVPVLLHQKINWGLGGTTTDVSDAVHPDNAALFERIAAVLKAPIVGIDFIIEDMSRSWKEQKRCGVIECNSMPFFDNHHLPFEGEPRNVAAAIWNMVDKFV